jgi:hypothetical protein
MSFVPYFITVVHRYNFLAGGFEVFQSSIYNGSSEIILPNFQIKLEMPKKHFESRYILLWNKNLIGTDFVL